MRKLPLACLFILACGVNRSPQPGAVTPCGRFQIVAGTAADFKTGHAVPTIIRIDTETGQTWYWNPPGEMGRGDWLPANDPVHRQ
jgi:DsbC/DsbD-like thiol-disulfide interchange protein